MNHHPGEQPLFVPCHTTQIQPQVRLVIADDHLLFNDGIKGLLATEDRYLVVEQVFDGNLVLPVLQKQQPDLLLLDINLPGTDGLQIAERLAQKPSRPKIVLLSMYSDALFTEKARALQLEGYLLKTASKQELILCLNEVSAGRPYYNDGSKRRNLHDDDEFMKKYKLTAREKEIIRLVKDGLSSQQIADTIFLSVYTVETHRRNINLKLGVKSPAELIKKAQEIGL
jgi:DNA-binding NarL/FixJ family response regulator